MQLMPSHSTEHVRQFSLLSILQDQRMNSLQPLATVHHIADCDMCRAAIWCAPSSNQAQKQFLWVLFLCLPFFWFIWVRACIILRRQKNLCCSYLGSPKLGPCGVLRLGPLANPTSRPSSRHQLRQPGGLQWECNCGQWHPHSALHRYRTTALLLIAMPCVLKVYQLLRLG